MDDLTKIYNLLTGELERLKPHIKGEKGNESFIRLSCCVNMFYREAQQRNSRDKDIPLCPNCLCPIENYRGGSHYCEISP